MMGFDIWGWRLILEWLQKSIFALYGVEDDHSKTTADQRAKLQADEIREHLLAIKRETPIRVISLLLIASISILYLPLTFVVLSVLLVLICDRTEVRLLSHSSLASRFPSYHRLAIGVVFVGELVFCFPTAVMWQIDDAFTKAISVGILAAALMRLATIRSIHPASGFAGISAQGSIIAVSNSYYWLIRGDYRGFAFTSLIAVVSLGYVAAAIVQNHRQIRKSTLSRMAAQQASDAKGYFLAQMSHELRTPLNAIIGMGTAALSRTKTKEDQEHLAILVKSAEGLGIVLDDVLDTAAIEEGRINIRPRLGDLRREIEFAVGLFRQSAIDTSNDLSVEFGPELPDFLQLDFDRLRQCIANLLSNALKNTHAGRVVVRARFHYPAILEIDVDDTGIGIPAGTESTIFNRSERRTKSASGNGLGLSICRAIINQMSGEIVALPSREGAKFRIRVPSTVVDPSGDGKPGSAQGPYPSALKILVVDDIGTNRLVAATYLKMLNYQTVESTNGPGAIQALQEDDGIDLVLLDINMPGMNGLETLTAIRAEGAERDRIPVIAMTADASERDRILYLQAGMDGYVSKPINLEALDQEIRRIMGPR